MSRQTFSRQLARLNRKHLGASERVNDAIRKIAANGVPRNAFRIPGINGHRSTSCASGSDTMAAGHVVSCSTTRTG